MRRREVLGEVLGGVLAAIAAPLLPGVPRPARAADAATGNWPDRPIRLIVPYAAGGGTDAIARAVAQKAGERLGATIVVDNRPGGAGNLATKQAAEAAPDGYTLLVGNIGPIAVNPSLFRNLTPDPATALAPVTLLAAAPMLILVARDLPVRDLAGLIALARAKPGEITYGSAGNGSANHLAGAYFALRAGIDIQHVPYRGAGPALNDLVAGTLQMMPATLPSSIGLVRDGLVRALAVTSAQRVPSLPAVPTVAEAGVPGYEMSGWYGIMAPARTPPAIIGRLREAVAEALREPALRERILAEGAEPSGDTPEEFGRFIAAERAKWAAVVRDARITVE
ncbi:tripartite tricarboxylate transporter substrate binding protein [Roseomonas sp. NAR14]|uniref:Tripartite tricarboxylate transporter substrate binding protein n=1 Tax=Roseomonas acroporae TaxID=2937791 RepID=A0A9X1YDN8_9PROT|nr:tripartite tricarboxylate transporter substrate binding protein [Roseomonas acroporae]MCK8787178.1 tripartite tricarboxylate transporter substrate binding protein [Roseomonas acroporae]